jgi:hypothetical protein
MVVNQNISKVVGDPSFNINASSNGIGVLSYSSSNPIVASVGATTGIVTILSDGSATITVAQPGNINYFAATSVLVKITVKNPTIPSKPMITKVEVSTTYANVHFTHEDNGGTALTQIEYSMDSGVSWTIASTVTSPITIQHLTENNMYSIILRSTNAAGTSEESEPLQFSNICFLAGTLIQTNQGAIAIEKIDPKIHTIRNKKICHITRTITQDKYLVCIEKNALGNNIPSEKTIISKNHCIWYNGKMIAAKHFVNNFENVKKVKYHGDVLYNVLMEEADKMMVNNLICETLDPENIIAKVYNLTGDNTKQEKRYIINKLNEYALKNKIYK